MMTKLLVTLFCCLAALSIVVAKGSLRKLSEETWDDMLQGEWMVEFYAPWCPACRGMQPTWEEFADWSDDLGIQVGQIDVTVNPGLSGRFMVTALPTLYHVKDGLFRQYKGSRSKDDLISYIEEKKWEATEPIPSWKSPQSIPMSFVSQFFKLSMILRAIHTQFVDNYGIPYWGSYGIFAVGTIICGAVLGLILVCIIDFIFPPKPFEYPIKKENEDDIKKSSPPSSETEDEDSQENKKELSNEESELRKRNVDKKDAKSSEAS